MNKKSLGRGLDEIFGGNVNEVIDNIKQKRSNGNVIEIAVYELIPNPFQPRKQFSIEELEGLAESIKQNGLFTPILVKKNEANKYYIVAGERRTRATKLAGLKTIKAIVAEISDSEMQRITLVENVQREDLNPVEIATSLKTMMEQQKLTQEELGVIVGKSRSYVATLLGILKLNSKITNSVLNGKITYGHAKPLIGLDDKTALNIFSQITEGNLNAREVEGYAKAAKLREARKNKEYVAPPAKTDHIIWAEGILRDKVKSKVDIQNNKIVIKYRGEEQLRRILERIDAIEK